MKAHDKTNTKTISLSRTSVSSLTVRKEQIKAIGEIHVKRRFCASMLNRQKTFLSKRNTKLIFY